MWICIFPRFPRVQDSTEGRDWSVALHGYTTPKIGLSRYTGFDWLSLITLDCVGFITV